MHPSTTIAEMARRHRVRVKIASLINVTILALLMFPMSTKLCHAQSSADFDLTWNRIASGGGTSVGTEFVLHCTIGQPEAGTTAGVEFTLNAGFYVGGRGTCVDNSDCSDANICTFDECTGGACSNLSNTYGDVDFNNTVNLFDLFCVLDGFGGVFGGDTDGNCTFGRLDIEPCAGNGSLNLFDLFAILDSFSGIDPCCSPSPTQTLRDRPGLAVDRPVNAPEVAIKLVASQRSIRAGDTVTVDVFASSVTDLRGYQIALDAVGGSRGALSSDVIAIDDSRDDYVFAQLESVHASDPIGLRIVGALIAGSATTKGETYLGSFTYRIPSNAHGTFAFNIRSGETMLVDTAGREFAIQPVHSVKIAVR